MIDLGLAYRVLDLCTGDLGFGNARTFDIQFVAAKLAQRPAAFGDVRHAPTLARTAPHALSWLIASAKLAVQKCGKPLSVQNTANAC